MFSHGTTDIQKLKEIFFSQIFQLWVKDLNIFYHIKELLFLSLSPPKNKRLTVSNVIQGNGILTIFLVYFGDSKSFILFPSRVSEKDLHNLSPLLNKESLSLRQESLASSCACINTFIPSSNFSEASCDVDPCHFGTDPHPDPQIRTSDFRIRILLFSSLAFKMPTKNKFFAYYPLCEGTFTNQFVKIKSHKEVTKQQKSSFFLLCLIVEGSRSPPRSASGSRHRSRSGLRS